MRWIEVFLCYSLLQEPNLEQQPLKPITCDLEDDSDKSQGQHENEILPFDSKYLGVDYNKNGGTRTATPEYVHLPC